MRFTFSDTMLVDAAGRAAALTHGFEYGAGWKLMRGSRSLAMILGLAAAGAQDGDELELHPL